MSGQPFTAEQRAEIKEIVNEALVEFFSTKGALGKNILIGAAIVIGSITVILGGAKAILGWIGFEYMTR